MNQHTHCQLAENHNTLKCAKEKLMPKFYTAFYRNQLIVNNITNFSKDYKYI